MKLAGGIKFTIHTQLYSLNQSFLCDPEHSSQYLEQAFQSSFGNEEMHQTLLHECTLNYDRLVKVICNIQTQLIQYLNKDLPSKAS